MGLEGGDVQQFASPVELCDRPVNKFVAGFIGSLRMNFFEATATDAGTVKISHGPEMAIAGLDRARLSGRFSVGLRPEHIEYSHDAGDVAGKIIVEEQLGSDAFFYFDVEGLGLVTVRAVGERDFHGGETVYLTFPPSRGHVFGADDQRISHE